MRASMTTMLSASLSILTWASTVSAQSGTQTALSAITTLGCYKDVQPLVKFGSDPYMTPGKCQDDCGKNSSPQHAVMAIIGGDTCYCGDILPALDEVTANSSCSAPCYGYGTMTCGGLSSWQVYLTGLTGAVQTAPNTTTSSSSSSSSTPTSTSPTVVTQTGQTVVVTASSTASSAAGGSGPNKVGIAVGVVLGLVAVGAAVAGLVLYLKQRRIRAIEEEHRRNATQAGFGKTSQTSETRSATDSRLDTSIFSHRRESVGSIADERDFSRRILQVRNPDHRASGVSNFA